MSLLICVERKNLAIKIYCVMMTILLISRYLLKIDVPDAVYLLVAVIPAIFGSTSELLACVVSFIPISTTFQYKYALIISIIAMLLKNRWRLKSKCAILLVFMMMVWELLHFGYGYFSVIEYARDFAELLFMGVLIMIDISDLDHKLIIRFLSAFTVGVCVIMFIMQLQQNNFDIVKLFSRNAASWRFGQSNMASGKFALNFDANILGFICNLSSCGLLLLRKRKENTKIDLVLIIASLFFALITLSRAAIICMFMIVAFYAFGGEKKGRKRIVGILSVFTVVAIIGIAVYTYMPAIFENLFERFQREDILNGRDKLFSQYMAFVFSSPLYLLFGVGMQGVIEKVSPVIWVDQLPHNGFQEALVVWGVPGIIAVFIWLWMIVRLSTVYSGCKRDFYQFVPLVLTLVFILSVQMLTESRTLLALSFSYICLCICGDKNEPDMGELQSISANASSKFWSKLRKIVK